MDEESKELMKIGVDAAMSPVTDILRDFLGLFGADWLHRQRLKNKERLEQLTDETLKRRGVTERTVPPEAITVPLLSASIQEGREELLNEWARLIATTLDPSRRNLYRREYCEILKHLEPLDAKVLRRMNMPIDRSDTTRNVIARELGCNLDETEVSFRSLETLGLLAPPSGQLIGGGNAILTAKGKEFLRALGE